MRVRPLPVFSAATRAAREPIISAEHRHDIDVEALREQVERIKEWLDLFVENLAW